VLKFIQAYRHRGKWRLRFRRRGYPGRELPVPRGYRGSDKPLPADCLDLLAAYQAAMAEPVTPLKPGEKRAAYGTVAWLVAEYFSSLDFLGRPKSVRIKHRKHCEDFRAKRGDLPVAPVQQVDLEKMFAKMIDTPAAANQWLDAMRDLFKYAIKRKLLVVNPAAEIKKRPSKNPDGHQTWELDEVAKFRAKHAIGTKARLAMEMMVTLAMRRSDAIRVGPPDVRDGVLRYTQHKMRERSPSRVEVPMPANLLAIIRQTSGTGIKTWLVDGTGKPFTEDAFSHWFADRVKEAGVPSCCTPHGLRKRCLTDLADEGKTIHQIMAVSGHLTMKEVERYTKMADRARNARDAMRGRTEQESNEKCHTVDRV
jgi:integrase